MNDVIGKGQPVDLIPARTATEAQRKALASTVRLRILRLCLHEDRTNRQLAEILGRDPATVLHHVRTLVDTGFLRAGDERRGKRGSREKPYRATGLSWQLELSGDGVAGGGLAGGGGAAAVGDRARGGGANPIAAILAAAAEEIASAPPDETDITRLGLKLTERSAAQLRSRLFEVIDEFAQRPPDPDGRPWSLLLTIFPEE